MRSCRFFVSVSLLSMVAFFSWGADQVRAQVLPADYVVDPATGYYVPDYYSTPNWANSPPLTKFIDPLPGLGDAGLPIARADVVTYPGSDYYEISLQQYSQTMHSELGPTTLRGYVQTNNGTDTSGCVAPPAGPGQTACTAGNNTVPPAGIRYLGPVIVAREGRPVRIKFTNNLPGGHLFLPVDTSIMGSGDFEINYDPATKAPIPMRTGTFSQSRATLHLHGGLTPWISDGTAHQWTAPAAVTDYPKGVSVAYVPDMWFDSTTGATIAACAGQTICGVANATNNPGPGKLTFYWTNDQSARFMFYHDHAYGITRLNVYAGEAAGYLINDPALEDTLSGLGVPGTIGTTLGTTDLTHLIPLVIQDKTFVNATIGNPAFYTVATDPTWAWGTQPGKPVGTPVTGDLWWPHVYMPAQFPDNPDLSGINAMGRWHYGPWFFPPTPVCFSAGGTDPKAVKPYCVDFGPVPNEYYNAGCDPYGGDPDPGAPIVNLCQAPMRPGTHNPSWGAEAFLDTMVVNGTAYPTFTVQPTKYRLRILNASHDRFLNLQIYRAVSKVDYLAAFATGGPYNFTGAPANLTEVAMVPASATAGFPDMWPIDGREGGVPDPATRGPALVQIGTEGGVLPKPVLLPNQPVQWNMDPTMFNVGNVLQQRDGGGTLLLGPAERADVIVDFTDFAGHTLILYNDAPTAFPALDPHYDYYTGAPDRTEIGGYGPILPGTGPNIRTVMQFVVEGASGAATPDDYNTAFLTALENAFKSTATTQGIFAETQHPIIVGQRAYDSAYNYTFPAIAPYWGLANIFSSDLKYDTVLKSQAGVISFQKIGDNEPATPLKMKAIHDEMGGTFDDYGRMSAKLGLEVSFVNAAIQNFILQNFVDPVTEIVKPDEVQIWRISHNGVDTHPIHFHLFDVQLINRVGWDGFIRLPDDNELGWKDTIRVAPLEDTIVALRPVRPPVPFRLPASIRPLNPTMPLGDTSGFSQIDITDGAALQPPMTNQLFNFGHEYTWHCHILSHEENDMMRPMALAVPFAVNDAPSGLTANWTGSVTVAWTDNSLMANGFRIQRALPTDPGFTAPQTFDVAAMGCTSPIGCPRTYLDTTAAAGTRYYYRVQAYSSVGATVPPTSYPSVTATTGWSNVVQLQLVPVAGVSPASLNLGTQTVNTTSAPMTVTLSNTGNGQLSFNISRNGANAGDFTVTNGTSGILAGGGTRAINVAFRPGALGPRTANLNIATNDPANPLLTVLLSGTGTVTPNGITVTSPNGGESWGGGTLQTIRWTYTGNPGSSVRIELLKGGVLNRTIIASRSVGSGGTGFFMWTVPSSQAPGNDYAIRVTSTTNGSFTDTSNANFTIFAPTITVTSPNGGESWAVGTPHAITWTYTGYPGSSVRIELLKGGAVVRTIANSTSVGAGGNGSFNWTVPLSQTPGSDYRIRVRSFSNGSFTDTSNANFTIAP